MQKSFRRGNEDVGEMFLIAAEQKHHCAETKREPTTSERESEEKKQVTQ